MLSSCNRSYKLFDNFAFMKTTLAERLNEAMKEAGVTPGDLAAACGIRLKSENPAFDSIEIQGDDLRKLSILGRKVWRAG